MIEPVLAIPNLNKKMRVRVVSQINYLLVVILELSGVLEV